MPTYKYFYFNGKARGELTRLIFKQAGVDFEDCRMEGPAAWTSTYKPMSPFGVAPWLEVTCDNGDTVKIGGSINIARFIAEQVGLAGKDATDNAVLGGIADCVNDFFEGGLKPLFAADSEKKDKMDQFCKDCPKWLSRIEGMIKANPRSGFLFEDKLTWVDIFVSYGVEYLSAPYPSIFEDYPLILALSKKVQEQPNIAEWIKTRPETPF